MGKYNITENDVDAGTIANPAREGYLDKHGLAHVWNKILDALDNQSHGYITGDGKIGEDGESTPRTSDYAVFASGDGTILRSPLTNFMETGMCSLNFSAETDLVSRGDSGDQIVLLNSEGIPARVTYKHPEVTVANGRLIFRNIAVN